MDTANRSCSRLGRANARSMHALLLRQTRGALHEPLFAACSLLAGLVVRILQGHLNDDSMGHLQTVNDRFEQAISSLPPSPPASDAETEDEEEPEADRAPAPPRAPAPEAEPIPLALTTPSTPPPRQRVDLNSTFEHSLETWRYSKQYWSPGSDCWVTFRD